MSVAAIIHESSLLLTLEEISQLVSHSHNPHETLGNIVRLIQGRFRTDVSSVYLLEPESGELVLAATVGLDQSGVGRVRMRLDEGLTGLVAERMSPIMEPDAPIHPRFKYFPEAGEDTYHSFLGVPLIESGIVQGVLVVQTMERRPFSPNEIRMLVTVGSQLAPLVSGGACWSVWPRPMSIARGVCSRGRSKNAALAQGLSTFAGNRLRTSLSDRSKRNARGDC